MGGCWSQCCCGKQLSSALSRPESGIHRCRSSRWVVTTLPTSDVGIIKRTCVRRAAQSPGGHRSDHGCGSRTRSHPSFPAWPKLRQLSNRHIGGARGLNLAFRAERHVSGAGWRMLISSSTSPHKPSDSHRRVIREQLAIEFHGTTPSIFPDCRYRDKHKSSFSVLAAPDLDPIQDQKSWHRSYAACAELTAICKRIPGFVDPRNSQVLEFPETSDIEVAALRALQALGRRATRTSAKATCFHSLAGPDAGKPDLNFLNPQNGVELPGGWSTRPAWTSSISLNDIFCVSRPIRRNQTTFPPFASGGERRRTWPEPSGHRLRRYSRTEYGPGSTVNSSTQHHPARYSTSRQCSRARSPRAVAGRDPKQAIA